MMFLFLETKADMKYVQVRSWKHTNHIRCVYAHISKKIEKDTMDIYEEYIKMS